MFSITREQFIAAIESGINEARESGEPLTDQECMMLRHIGKTEGLSARSTFATVEEGNRCYCPLSAAGIEDGQGKDVPRSQTYFYGGFDRFTRDLFPRDGFLGHIGGFAITD